MTIEIQLAFILTIATLNLIVALIYIVNLLDLFQELKNTQALIRNSRDNLYDQFMEYYDHLKGENK